MWKYSYFKCPLILPVCSNNPEPLFTFHKLELITSVNIFYDLNMLIFKVSKIVLFSERFPSVLQLANKSIFNFADIEDEALLPLCPFSESGSDSIEKNLFALLVGLTFAGLARIIRTD